MPKQEGVGNDNVLLSTRELLTELLPNDEGTGGLQKAMITIVANKTSFQKWLLAQPPGLREQFRHAYQPEHLRGIAGELVILLNDWQKLPMAEEIRLALNILRYARLEIAIIRAVDGGEHIKDCNPL